MQSPVTNKQAQDAYTANQAALAQQQAFLQATQAQNGLGNQSQVYNQLQDVAAGQGPNPAQNMLNQATGANVANQAALMAGQRGSSANTGLIARQAGMQGANIQQQAAGQGATMQANQSLNALGAAGQMANTQAGQQQAAVNANTGAQQNEQAQLLNSIAGVNSANVSNQAGINQANAGITQSRNQMIGNMVGGVAQGIGAAAGKGAEGGFVKDFPKMAEGGQAPQPSNYLHQYFNPSPGMPPSAVQPMMAEGGKVPALVSPGEKYLAPQQVQAVKQGASPMAEGTTIPGKPKVSGAKNSYANDTVKKDLDEGGIVIPRSVTQSKNPDKKAEEFVLAVLAKHGHMPKKSK